MRLLQSWLSSRDGVLDTYQQRLVKVNSVMGKAAGQWGGNEAQGSIDDWMDEGFLRGE